MSANPILPALSAEWSPVVCISKEKAGLYVELFRQRYPVLADQLNGRLERAAEILTTPGACRQACRSDDTEAPWIFQVHSKSNPHPGAFYEVDLKAKTCTCPDSGKGNLCKHRLAIGLHLYGPDWDLEHRKAMLAEAHARRNAEEVAAILAAKASEAEIYEARRAADAAWKQAQAAIDRWEAAATTLRLDHTYPTDEELADLRAAMDHAMHIYSDFIDIFNALVSNRIQPKNQSAPNAA